MSFCVIVHSENETEKVKVVTFDLQNVFWQTQMEEKVDRMSLLFSAQTHVLYLAMKHRSLSRFSSVTRRGFVSVFKMLSYAVTVTDEMPSRIVSCAHCTMTVWHSAHQADGIFFRSMITLEFAC
jgi:hypothetical protein